MFKSYVGTKLIKARPAPNPNTGEAGYEVVYPDGYAHWSPLKTFDHAYREVSPEEAELVFSTMSAPVPHGDHDQDPPACEDGKHDYGYRPNYDVEFDGFHCARCDHVEDINTPLGRHLDGMAKARSTE